MMIWDATDSLMKKGDMGEVRGGAGSGVDTSGTPVDDDIAVFTDADTIEGKTLTELSLLIGTDVEAHDTTLTDIADGTIAENLVNTANPWADNEVSDTLTASILAATADADLNNLDIVEVKTVQFNGVYAIGNSGSTETVDWQNGAYQSITIDEACVISFSNEYVGTLNLRVTYGGSYALTFSGMTLLEEGGTEIVTTDAAGVDVLIFKNWGTADTYDMGALLDIKD